MNRCLLILLFIILQLTAATAQTENIYDASQKKTIKNYLKEEPRALQSDEFRILLHLNYGQTQIKNKSDLLLAYSGRVKEVNLYYSDYPKERDFKSINSKRIDLLLGGLELLKDSTITWNLIEQTQCKNQIEAEKLFHGFELIIQFSEEINLTTIKIDTAFNDFVVEKVLERNNWRDMLIVTDMTGSMSPYISQLFLWLKLNTIDDRIKQFVFFNDGDTSLDNHKEVGKTGGIYQTKSKEYNEIEKVAIQSMLSGNGGDLAENDIESILRGLQLCPNCKENILIADNNSPVRDLTLLKKIDRPIRVIICGSAGKINPEYLNLARATGGSIHLMEEDLFHLIKLNEGEAIEVNGATYKIHNNAFVEIKDI